MEVVMAIVAGCGGGEDDQRKFATAWRAIKLAAVPEQQAAGQVSPSSRRRAFPPPKS
jgi:hypothetical protein